MARSTQTPSFLDPDPPFVVRTPKRPGGYAAQAWASDGYWEARGLFATTAQARAGAKALVGAWLGAGITPELAVWHKKRCDGHRPRHKWVRRVKGGAWQARYWLGAGRGSLNLGLFTVDSHGANAEWAAGQVSAAFDREWKGARTVKQVVVKLKRTMRVYERVPEGVEVPPRHAELVRVKGGAKVRKDRELIAAEEVARRARRNLFRERITPQTVLDKWRREEERREEYFADFEQGLREGETVEGLVELLAG